MSIDYTLSIILCFMVVQLYMVLHYQPDYACY